MLSNAEALPGEFALPEIATNLMGSYQSIV